MRLQRSASPALEPFSQALQGVVDHAVDEALVAHADGMSADAAIVEEPCVIPPHPSRRRLA